MKLLKIFDSRTEKHGAQPIIYRNAVRAIILKENKLLFIYSEKTKEYKFPGGGVEQDEPKEDALKREVLEETGHEISSVNEVLGYVDQLYNDIYDSQKYFYQRSYYYFCEITEEYKGLKLSESERAMQYLPKWVTLDEAIRANELKIKLNEGYPWTQRELYVMKLLKGMRG